MNGSRFLKVKEWFLDKAEETSSHYNTYIDFYGLDRDEHGFKIADAEGYQVVLVEEQLQESEKAIKVRLSTGDVVGSYKGWTLWIPKSLVKELNDGINYAQVCFDMAYNK